MKKQNLTWTPFLFFLLRDIRRFYKVRVQTILIPLINHSLYLVIFGVSLGKSIRISDEFSYLEFIIPGLICMGTMNNAFQNGSSSIFVMKITGEIIDLRTTALSKMQVVWGVTLSGLLRGLIIATMTLCLGELFYYVYEGGWMPVRNPGFLLFFLILGGMTFAQVGLAVGIWSRNFDHVGAVSGFILLPLIYLGGVFFDLDKLAPFWQKVSLFNPLLYFVNGVRYGVLGDADVLVWVSAGVAVLSLATAYLIAFYYVAVGSFHRAS